MLEVFVNIFMNGLEVNFLECDILVKKIIEKWFFGKCYKLVKGKLVLRESKGKEFVLLELISVLIQMDL